MAVFTCKMCGGGLNVAEGITVVECEYCGSKQTVPSADNEKKVALFERANKLRSSCEFDKASGVYESIVAEFRSEAEAYWGLVLCKYGIEYVDDPATDRKIPTCHRSSFDSVMEDENYEQALENADVLARKVYRDEARQIEELRKSIIEVSSSEEPYEIFICYKETDAEGNRTVDSTIAQDVYDALTEKGYRVFFSRISLEDKLGQEYEPYIFAALNSSKVMLAFGTDYEYYNAVWVKNEWSRYLQLIAAGQKKTLIPCYKGIDAYDMPKEFAKLQAQDMGKVGAVQDLLRGIEKLIGSKNQPQPTVVVPQNTATVESLLKRAYMYLADKDFQNANAYCEKVLDIDPENVRAYVGKLLVDLQCPKEELLPNTQTLFENNLNYKKAITYADAGYAAKLKDYCTLAEERYEHDAMLQKQRRLAEQRRNEEIRRQQEAEKQRQMELERQREAEERRQREIAEAEEKKRSQEKARRAWEEEKQKEEKQKRKNLIRGLVESVFLIILPLISLYIIRNRLNGEGSAMAWWKVILVYASPAIAVIISTLIELFADRNGSFVFVMGIVSLLLFFAGMLILGSGLVSALIITFLNGVVWFFGWAFINA